MHFEKFASLLSFEAKRMVTLVFPSGHEAKLMCSLYALSVKRAWTWTREVYASSTHAVFRYVELIWCIYVQFHSFGMRYKNIFLAKDLIFILSIRAKSISFFFFILTLYIPT